MQSLLKLVIFFCVFNYVAPNVNIPAIFQKPKKTIELPTPKTLEIREATSEEYNCVGRTNGNHANLKDCMSFWACVSNQTYFIVCPELGDYQTYFNPIKRVCDRSDEFACLTYVADDEEIGVTADKEDAATEDSSKESDSENISNGEKKEESKKENESKEQKDQKNPGEELDNNEKNKGESKEQENNESKEQKENSGEEQDNNDDEESYRFDDEL